MEDFADQLITELVCEDIPDGRFRCHHAARTLEGHEAELDKYAAQKVTENGTMKGETITVESVVPAR